LKLPAVTSVAHATLGQIFFSLMVCIAVLTGAPVIAPIALPDNQTGKLRRLALMTTGFIIFQLIAGAIYRHTGEMFHLHLLGAVLVLVHVILLSKRILTGASLPSALKRPAVIALALLVIQIGLGIFTYYMPSVADATTHVAVGALLLATSAVISLQSYRQVVPA
jgi:heme A synthase